MQARVPLVAMARGQREELRRVDELLQPRDSSHSTKKCYSDSTTTNPDVSWGKRSQTVSVHGRTFAKEEHKGREQSVAHNLMLYPKGD